MNVIPDSGKSSITLIGNIICPRPGVTLYVEGEWKTHSTYGKQFVSTLCNEIMPDTVYGLRKYLGSGLIKGIGPVFAEKIVDKFKDETPDIIENHPERLKEIPRLGQKKIDTLVESWNRQKHMFDIMVFLKSFDISTLFAVKIYKLYGDDAISLIQENPYRLITDIDGIGFFKADAIAIRMGYDLTSIKRRNAGIIYILNQYAEEGNTYALYSFLSTEVATLLELSQDSICEAIDSMVEKEDLIKIEDTKIFLPYYYYAEQNIAKKLKFINNSFKAMDKIQDITLDDIEQHLDIKYNNEQREAIKTALYNNLMVLTGGPGTGKTTVTRGIITALRLLNKRILLAAPTGKAADRMSEATEMEAKTIHRLLGYNPAKGYQYNRDFPLMGDVLIIDETSMINVQLMNTLLDAVPNNMKLIFVGDVDQLPCIGAGNLLSDMIKSEIIPTVKLKEIYRQAATSKIITTAHAINKGIIPDLKNDKSSDLFFIQDNDDLEMTNLISELVINRLPKTYEIKPTEIQVLTPMKKGPLGTKYLNERLQEVINTTKGNEIKYGDTTFREHDKVMQIKNNYDKGVFNGDSGFIQSIDTVEKTMTVIFRKQVVDYEYSDLDELMLAYAVTVHKSQGSEYPIVILPITKAHYVMMKRNLIYTGITRAKNLCILIGQKQTLFMGINNVDTTKRNTYLKEFLLND